AAAFRTSQLGVAFLSQETGVRGYALSAQRTFLRPYFQGVMQQRQNVGVLHDLLTGMPVASADLARVITLADTWRTSYAEPTIRQVAATGKPAANVPAGQGKAEFDALRTALQGLQTDLAVARGQAVPTLSSPAP